MDSGWIVKTIAGAALTAVVGFMVTQYLESRSGPDARRVESERRLHEARVLELKEEQRRSETARSSAAQEAERASAARRQEDEARQRRIQNQQQQGNAQPWNSGGANSGGGRVGVRPGCENPFVQVCGSMGCLREPKPGC